MAYLTVNSTFNPYTFDELVKPFVMYDTAYQQEVARTNELLEKAAALEDLSPTLDKEAYDSYQNWKGQLKAISDQIAERGLDINTKRAITGLGNTYRTDYLPYTEKLKTRGALIKEQREYLQKHPNAFFDVDYSTTPVGDISTASSYNTYDLDDITTKVMTDAYGKLLNGESVNLDDYMAQYGSGLTDESRIEQVRKAIGSGVSIASANKKQKDLENYLKELQVKRSYSRGSGGGGGGTSSAVGRDININKPDGSGIIQLKYNKRTKEYEYKDSNNQLRSVSDLEHITEEDIIRDYYGGYYDKLDVQGSPVRRVISDDGYLVRTTKGWQSLPKGGSTTYREYLKATGNEIALPTEDQLRRLPYGIESMSDLDKKLKRRKYTEDFIYPEQFADYADSPLLKNIIAKLGPLVDSGMLGEAAIRVYKDPRGNIVGYSTDADMGGLSSKLNAPIEQDWKDKKKALDALRENGPMD